MNDLATLSSIYTFNDHRQVLKELKAGHQRLAQRSDELLRKGVLCADQDHKSEIWHLCPQDVKLDPLVLIGGMGPKAGLDGLEKAIKIFQGRREIILIQACSVPARSELIIQMTAESNEVNRSKGKNFFSLTQTLSTAIKRGIDLLRHDYQEAEVVLLCNTVHFFLSDIKRSLYRKNPDFLGTVRIHSLVDATIQHSYENTSAKPLVILATQGSRRAGLYNHRLKPYYDSIYNLSSSQQGLLDLAIEKGAKANSYENTVKFGLELINQIYDLFPEGTCILMGCTEVCLILECLRNLGDLKLLRFLNRCDLLDPVNCAFEHPMMTDLSIANWSM